MERRDFLQKLPALAAPLLLGGIPLRLLAKENELFQLAASNPDSDRVLVIIQLHGGNDGLNTLVPINQYSKYYSLRSNIAIPQTGNRKYINLDGTLADNAQIGLHPDMTGMKALYDQGKMAVVQGVAYENFNQSHFRSRDIWLMGGDYDDYLGSGWAGRYLDKTYPGKTDKYLEYAKKAWPTHKRPSDLMDIDMRFRPGAVYQANVKSAVTGGAPVYMYLFDWQSPVLDGKYKSVHCMEIAFAFNTIQRTRNMTGGTKEAQKLADKVNLAWVNFAKTGNPNHKGLPKWPAYTEQNTSTMHFDNVCTVKPQLDKELIELVTGQ